MVQTRSSRLPVEDSWRMVEGGENDSFDTAIVHDPFEDDPFVYSSQSQPSQQPPSTQDSYGGSQDSIRDFINKVDEEELIRRAPFHPSLSSNRRMSMDKDRTPVPEFFMPSIDVNNQQQDAFPFPKAGRPSMKGPQLVKRRGNRPGDTNQNAQRPNQKPNDRPSLSQRFASSAPEFLFDLVAWTIGILRMALRYAQKPLAIMLAVYLAIGACMMAKDMVIHSIMAPLMPLCRVPGASLLSLPFCPDALSHKKARDGSVEFDELMNVQSQFEKVLEDSAQGVSIPMDMKRSEASVRDLRTMVKYSDLPTRDEMVHEFDNYIDSIRVSADDLTMFNTHVGGAVDSVISINRWTSRYIDSIAENREANNNMLSRFGGWVFSPFQVSVFDEHVLLDKYIEHTALVSDKIANLIVEAQAIRRHLSQAEDSLQLISEHVVHTGNVVKEKHSEVFWNIWTLVGANTRRLHNLNVQLGLLQQVEAQRHSAVRRLDSLVHDLYDIQTKLSDLRDRVAAPELLADTASIPLSVHIETINAGVERLETARGRIRAEENERLQQALQRSRENDRLIDG